MRKLTLLDRIHRLSAGLLLAVAGIGAQAMPLALVPEQVAADDGEVVMEIMNLDGETTQFSLRGGMTVYLPQGRGWRIGYLVVCDEQGIPVFYYRMDQLANLRYLNVPSGSPATDVFAGYTPPSDDYLDDTPWLTWRVGGQDYKVDHEGELHLSSDLKTLSLTLSTGKTYDIPLAATEFVHHRDTLNGIGTWVDKLENALVYRWAYHNGEIETEDLMHLNFSAMVPESRNGNFSLFVPSDAALHRFVDVLSLTSIKPRALDLSYSGTGRFPITITLYRYDPETGEMGDAYPRTENFSQDEITNRLAMLLRSHTIFHNRPEDRALGVRSGNEYYLALDGSVIRVISKDGEPQAVQGTFQMDEEAKGHSSFRRCYITKSKQKGNGWLYEINAPMNATTASAYSVLTTDGTFPANSPYARFAELCIPYSDVLEASGLIDETLPASQRAAALSRLMPFIQNGGLQEWNLNYVANVPFTIYVPTNEAIDKEIAAGNLSTWESIAKDLEACAKDEYGNLANEADQQRITAQCARVLAFVRTHIQFGIEIADQLPFDRTHNTTFVNSLTLCTPHLRVQGTGKGRMTVTDECGNTRNVLDAHKNVFVREVACTRNNRVQSPYGQNTMNNVVATGYAPGVIHQIDGVLKYKE